MSVSVSLCPVRAEKTVRMTDSPESLEVEFSNTKAKKHISDFWGHIYASHHEEGQFLDDANKPL